MKFSKLEFKRHMCFGACPVYSIVVTSDGKVDWYGEDFVDEIGERTWLISKQRVKSLGEALDKAHFNNLRKAYDSYEKTDMAGCTVTVELENGWRKSVYHYEGDSNAPDELIKLEKDIDRLVGTKPYVGIFS